MSPLKGLLSGKDETRILNAIREAESRTSGEIRVRIERAGGKDPMATARKAFESLGMRATELHNGVMILVAAKDRTCRIELGKGYGRRYDAAMKGVIDERMIPYFKEGDYSRGIYEGARGVVEKVTKKVSWLSFYKWHLVIGALILVCVFAGVSCMRKGKKGWGWAFFAAAGVLLLFLIKMMASGKSSSGFGGGSSFGGGASGSW